LSYYYYFFTRLIIITIIIIINIIVIVVVRQREKAQKCVQNKLKKQLLGAAAYLLESWLPAEVAHFHTQSPESERLPCCRRTVSTLRRRSTNHEAMRSLPTKK